MTIQEEIISLIGKLDYTWYTRVNDLFVAEEGYDHDTKKVKRIVPDFYSHYDQETGEGDTSDWIVNSGVEEYAWDYSHIDYPWFDDRPETEKEKLPALDSKLPVQGYIISRHLLKVISDNINESPDVIQQDQFITKVLTIVNGKVKETEKIYRDTEYSTVALHFYKSFRADVSDEYRHIRRNADKQRNFQTFLESDFWADAQDTNYNSDEQVIRNILKPLSGKWLKIEIMKSGDFDKLISNTIHFIESKGESIEEKSMPFRTNKISADFIRYTFNSLYNEKINGNITQAKWATFLKKSFDVFSKVEEATIRKKLSTKPLNYDTDLLNTITYHQSPKSPKVT